MILDDASYGTERNYNGLRLALNLLSKVEGAQVTSSRCSWWSTRSSALGREEARHESIDPSDDHPGALPERSG
jgi:hypothetical protein